MCAVYAYASSSLLFRSASAAPKTTDTSHISICNGALESARRAQVQIYARILCCVLGSRLRIWQGRGKGRGRVGGGGNSSRARSQDVDLLLLALGGSACLDIFIYLYQRTRVNVAKHVFFCICVRLLMLI